MKNTKVRLPAAAGTFYPAGEKELKDTLSRLIDKNAPKRDVTGCILPHAGYTYSGKIAAQTLSGINIRDSIILLGPNHTGKGEDFSLMHRGQWQTPLGRVDINELLADKLLESSSCLKADETAHAQEHSIEAEIPFLQYLKPVFRIVPVAIMSDDFSALRQTGEEIAGCLLKNGLSEKTTLIASTDLTHYETQASAEIKDHKVINAILELDENALIENINRYNISMCGYAPVITLLAAAKKLGATRGELIKYQTSAAVTADTSSVVGYAGMIIY